MVRPSGIIIGRDRECELRLGSSDISRKHCSLRPSLDGIVVIDLRSRNGTYVNNALIEAETLLMPGDVIRVGPLELQVPGGVEEPDEPDTLSPKYTNTPANDETSATDDEIVSWLADADQSTPELQDDTTIINVKLSDGSGEHPRKQFRSVADEAAHIIAKYHQQVEDDEHDEDDISEV